MSLEIIKRESNLRLEIKEEAWRKKRSEVFYGFLSNYTSLATITAYRNDLKLFFSLYSEEFGIKRVDEREIEDIHILRVLQSMKERGRSEKSINRLISSIGSYFDYLLIKRYIWNNPFQTIRRSKTSQDVITRSIPLDRFKDIEDWALKSVSEGKIQDGIMILLFFNLGRRVGEISSLKVRNISIKGSHSYLEIKLKGGKTEFTPIREDLHLLISEHIKDSNLTDEDFLFFTRDKRVEVSRNKIDRLFKRLGKDLGLEMNLHPHVARASVITKLLSMGEPLQKVAKYVSHSTIEMTEKYNKNLIKDNEYLDLQEKVFQ